MTLKPMQTLNALADKHSAFRCVQDTTTVYSPNSSADNNPH